MIGKIKSPVSVFKDGLKMLKEEHVLGQNNRSIS